MNAEQKSFIEVVGAIASADMKNSGVAASLTTAQAILESAWGKSELTKTGNALFGIKATKDWKGKTLTRKTTEYEDGKKVQVEAEFRAYDTWEDSVKDHSAFLKKYKRYAKVIGETDYKEACKAVAAAGYATDPEYAKKLIELNKELPVQLAQNTYNNKLRSLVKKRLEQLRRILKDYDDNEIDVLYTKEHPERQKLIKPIQPTWEQRLSEWEKEEYKGKTFAENIPVITTAKGERVRSKSEKILADYFYHTGIPYKYEHPVILKRFGIVYPDFTFLSPKTGEEIYWEHDGRMDDPEYARKAIKKIETYEKNGIFPGQRLVLTFETLQDGLDMKIVEKLAREYLL